MYNISLCDVNSCNLYRSGLHIAKGRFCMVDNEKQIYLSKSNKTFEIILLNVILSLDSLLLKVTTDAAT